jgi:EAL domain-containing protein (putative c-di-GMP-specific phosphodiesterase class I)
MRFAVESCLKDGGMESPDAAFSASFASTLRDAEAFRAIVRERRFDLHYQPIDDLQTGPVHHFEALARFSKSGGPTDVIHMAEELALIAPFDLAVAAKAIARLRKPGAGLLKFAINISGASLANDAYVETLLEMTSIDPDIRKRLIVEVTETAALADIEAANRRLGALRRAGIRACIDDFGSGASSYDYLHGLSVDTVKIDGRFVQGIERDERSRTLVKHLIDLCGSLKLTTIAEMIETEEAASILKGLGVDHGQGWLYGRAEAEPRTSLAQPTAVRRKGVVEAWG